MTVLVSLLMIAALAAAISFPLFVQASPERLRSAREDVTERLEREKHVALLAIKEADFDRAMGKLSDTDYTSLREVYEDRALSALSALDQDASSDHSIDESLQQATTNAFCTACGNRFAETDRFCGACGQSRGTV